MSWTGFAISLVVVFVIFGALWLMALVAEFLFPEDEHERR